MNVTSPINAAAAQTFQSPDLGGAQPAPNSAVAKFRSDLQVADSGQKAKNDITQQLTGALAAAGASQPRTNEARMTNEAIKSLGNTLVATVFAPGTPAAARPALKAATDGFTDLVHAHAAGDQPGAASAALRLGTALNALKAAAPQTVGAQGHLAAVIKDLNAEAGPATKLSGPGNSLDAKIAPTLEKLNHAAPDLAGPRADTINSLRGAAAALGSLAAHYGNANSPADLKKAVGTAIKDFNKLAGETKAGPAGDAARAKDTAQFMSDIKGVKILVATQGGPAPARPSAVSGQAAAAARVLAGGAATPSASAPKLGDIFARPLARPAVDGSRTTVPLSRGVLLDVPAPTAAAAKLISLAPRNDAAAPRG